MSVIGGIGQPADEPVHAPKLAPTTRADPADTVGLDPADIGLDRPAQDRLNDDFDLLIEGPPARRGASRSEGQSEVSPAELIVAAIDSPTPPAGDVSVASPIDNQVIELIPTPVDEIVTEDGSLSYEGESFEGTFGADTADPAAEAYAEPIEGSLQIGGQTYEIDKTNAPDLFGQ